MVSTLLGLSRVHRFVGYNVTSIRDSRAVVDLARFLNTSLLRVTVGSMKLFLPMKIR